jgi:hypothetical protein
MAKSAELSTLLERLLATEVEFVLVGGLAAVVQGAPITTLDVDIVHRRTPENVDRLLVFLASVDARYRGRPEPPLPPSRTALLGPGHSLFMTDLGPLDVLGAIEEGAEYDQLVPRSLVITIAGRPLHVLSLETIVAFKRASADAKDKLRLPVLEAVLRRGRRA